MDSARYGDQGVFESRGSTEGRLAWLDQGVYSGGYSNPKGCIPMVNETSAAFEVLLSVINSVPHFLVWPTDLNANPNPLVVS